MGISPRLCLFTLICLLTSLLPLEITKTVMMMIDGLIQSLLFDILALITNCSMLCHCLNK